MLAPPEQSSPQVGGTFKRLLVGTPESLNPFAIQSDLDVQLHEYVSDFLAIRNPDTLQLEPRLAEKWNLIDQGKGLNILLRKGIKFADGSDFGAEDVVASFEALKLESYMEKPRALKLDFVESVRLLGPLRVVVRFKQPLPEAAERFLEYFVVGQRRLLSEAPQSDSFRAKYNALGPYKVTAFDAKKTLSLERRPDWYGFQLDGGKSQHWFEKIELSFVDGKDAFQKAVRRKQQDLIGPIPLGWDHGASDSALASDWDVVKVKNLSPRRFSFIVLNHLKMELRSKAVREAMALSLNRDEINSRLYQGKLNLLVGPHWPPEENWSAGLGAVPFSPSKAGEVLKADGWLLSEQDPVAKKTISGKEHKLAFKLIYASEDLKGYFDVYREDLARVGIRLEVVRLDWPQFVAALQAGDFDAAALAKESERTWSPRSLWHSKSHQLPGANFGAYAHSKVDQWIERAEAAKGPIEKSKNLSNLYRHLTSELVAIPLFVLEEETFLVSKKIHRPQDSFRYRLADWTWWFKKPL